MLIKIPTLTALCTIVVGLAAASCAAEREAPPAEAKAIEDIVNVVAPVRGFGCIQTAQFDYSGRRVFAVWYDPFSGRAACYLYAYYFDYRKTRWIRFVDCLVDHSSDLSAECKPNALVFRNGATKSWCESRWRRCRPGNGGRKRADHRAVPSDGVLIFEGTVTSAEPCPTTGCPRRIMSSRCESIVS